MTGLSGTDSNPGLSLTCPLSLAVPLQLPHIGAVLWKHPDASAIRRPSVQVESQMIHLLCLAAGEARHPAGSWDRSQVVDPEEVSRLMGR